MNSSELLVNGKKEEGGKRLNHLTGWAGSEISSRGITCRAEHGGVDVRFVSDTIVRVTAYYGAYRAEGETGVVLQSSRTCNFCKRDSGNDVSVETSRLRVAVSKTDFTVRVQFDGIDVSSSSSPFAWHRNSFVFRNRLSKGHRIYGLGEKTGFLDKRGKTYTMWNSDVFSAHTSTTDPLYVSIPFFMSVGEDCCYGMYLDNSWRTVFDMGETSMDEYAVSADGGNLDYYIIAGNSPADVLSQYVSLTGVAPIPPAWALGNNQSRYSYRSEEEVLSVAAEFSRRKIPCSAIHLDIHHMDDNRTLTWDEDLFHDPAAMTEKLHGLGIKTVMIVDPGIKVDPSYALYREMAEKQFWCRYVDGSPYVGNVWPGKSVFPDFTRADVRRWWGDAIVSFMERYGIDGIWHDMNEPAVFNDTSTMDVLVAHGDPSGDTHERYHNVYGMLESKATYEAIREKMKKRPFILTRAGFAGIQRYAAVWTGDNRSMWEHLELSLPMLLNMGLSGLSFIGADIGGFSFNTNSELLVRWYQLGMLYPFARNHCENHARRQEPWVFGPDVERLITDSIRIRGRFMPDLYTSCYLAHVNGRPVIRPLLFDYHTDQTALSIYDQFLFGDGLMAAPVVRPGVRNRAVYLPQGVWFDYYSGARHEGHSWIIADAPIERMPLFVRAGSILLTEETEGAVLTVTLYLDASVESHEWVMYEDDGESLDYEKGSFALETFGYTYNGQELRLAHRSEHAEFRGKYRTVRIAVKHAHGWTSVDAEKKRIVSTADDETIVELPFTFATAVFS